MTAACPACTVDLGDRAAPAPRAADVVLSLPGIHCAACIGKVERALKALPGVDDARVNLTLKRVAVSTGRPTEDLAATLRAAGYDAYPLNVAALGGEDDRTGRDLLLRLGVAGFAMMNVMLLSVAVWSGAADATRDLFHLISAAISLPVVLFSGQPFFRSAWSALRVRRLNMDVPISLAIGLAAGMSLYEALEGGRHAYFDAALALTFFLLIGRYLDHRTRAAAHSAARELSALETHTATRLTDAGAETVEVSTLAPGDRLLIPTGTRVPVDGRLMAGATTDRSFLTGESAAVRLAAGDAVQAGEINLGAPFAMEATATGEDTTLRRIAGLVDRAENARNRYTTLADRAARVYAPAVHLLAFAAFAGWLAATGDIRLALNIAIAVLIITCPCALGLAVPAVSTAAIGRLYALGYLVKSGTALERLAETDRLVFDKTGTLTLPAAAAPVAALTGRQKSVARAPAPAADHPVSRASAAATAGVAPAPVTGIAEHEGLGLEGTLDGQCVRLGKGDWLGAAFDGTALRIGDEVTPLAAEETLRDGAAEAVAALSDLHPHLISGDREDATAAVAARLDMSFEAGQSPIRKHDRLAALAAAGHRVAMVGDGLNDTAALAAAHASIAPSSALDASRNAADVVILRDHLADLPALFAVARAATRLSRQNFAIAALYNLVAVPIALAGHATPLMAALAMSLSSLTVLANALRVRRVA